MAAQGSSPWSRPAFSFYASTARVVRTDLPGELLSTGQLERGFRYADRHRSHDPAVVSVNGRGEARQVLPGLLARFGPTTTPNLRELTLQLFDGGHRPLSQLPHLHMEVPVGDRGGGEREQYLACRGCVRWKPTANLGDKPDGAL